VRFSWLLLVSLLAAPRVAGAQQAAILGTWKFDLKQDPKKEGPRMVIVRPDSSAVLYAASSPDGGSTWSPRVRVDTADVNTTGCNRPAPSIAVDPAAASRVSRDKVGRRC